MLSLHLFFGRPRLLLPETSSLSDFAQMWLGSRLKHWPNHFSLLFSRKVSTGFTRASFLISSFVMWSNPVFPLAHLIILISAEFSLLSSFFFMAQHSEPERHRWSDDCFEEFVFQFYGHLPIAHHPGHCLPLHPSDSYPIVDISL